jgi:hypothetical protein
MPDNSSTRIQDRLCRKSQRRAAGGQRNPAALRLERQQVFDELREKENKIPLASSDEFKLKAVTDVLQAKLVKRSVPLRG